MADTSGNKKRLREVKKEIADIKEKLTNLKAERDQLKTALAAENTAEEAK